MSHGLRNSVGAATRASRLVKRAVTAVLVRHRMVQAYWGSGCGLTSKESHAPAGR